MKAAPIVLAVFDMDGTLTRRDTLLPFLFHLVGPAALVRAAGWEFRSLVSAASGRGDRNRAKEALLGRVLSGLPEDAVREAGERFAAGGAYRLRPEVVDLVRWHQAQGHETAVISAGLHVYVRPIVARVGVDRVAATRLSVREGVLTGQLEGLNVRGSEKVAHLRQLVAGRQVRLVAYGDSAGDLDLLDAVDHAVWCGRRAPRRLGHLHLRRAGAPVLSVLAERLKDLPPGTAL